MDENADLQSLTKAIVKDLKDRVKDFDQINGKLDLLTLKFDKVESDLAVSRNVTSVLKERIIKLEVSSAANEYSNNEGVSVWKSLVYRFQKMTMIVKSTLKKRYLTFSKRLMLQLLQRTWKHVIVLEKKVRPL